MDPVTALVALVSLTRYLWDAADKVQQSREECRRLATHVNHLLKLVEMKIQSGLSPDILSRLQKLTETLTGLNVTLDELSNQSWLKKILWREHVAGRIAQAYKDLSEAVQLFQLGAKIDLRRFQQENEDARRADTEQLHASLRLGIQNDYEILKLLELKTTEMQEAMVTLHNRFRTLEDSLERQFLEKGLHAMQRRSGAMKMTPDEFAITSLDIIIHHDRKLGEGGFGQVFQAEWQGITVAVKLFRNGIPPLIFQKEIDVWKRLRHPNILEFYGACSIADPPFCVCAFKSKGDAVNYLHSKPYANRCKLIYEASLGLKYLHQSGVVHGDLKASNILIDSHEIACLSDFGLSKIRTRNSSTTHAAWKSINSNPVQGSLRWMAPEQMKFGITNKVTDVYSFGMTLYEIFSGDPPFASTEDSVLFAVVVDRGLRPPRPNTPPIVKQGLDGSLWAFLEVCWSQEPDKRPTASAIAVHLGSLSLVKAEKPLVSEVETHSGYANPRPSTITGPPSKPPRRPQIASRRQLSAPNGGNHDTSEIEVASRDGMQPKSDRRHKSDRFRREVAQVILEGEQRKPPTSTPNFQGDSSPTYSPVINRITKPTEHDNRHKTQDSDVLTALLTRLSDDDKYVRQSALTCILELAQHGDARRNVSDSEVAAALATAISDKDRDVFQNALTCFSYLAHDTRPKVLDSEVIAALLTKLASEDVYVRKSVLSCVRELVRYDDFRRKILDTGVVASLVTRLEDSDKYLRQSALSCVTFLAKQADSYHKILDSDALAAILARLTDKHRYVRQSALTCVLELAQHDDTHYKLLDSEVAMALATGIADKDRNVFQHALTCVTFLALDSRHKILNSNVVAAVLTRFADEDTYVRQSALSCIRKLARHDDSRRKLLDSDIVARLSHMPNDEGDHDRRSILDAMTQIDHREGTAKQNQRDPLHNRTKLEQNLDYSSQAVHTQEGNVRMSSRRLRRTLSG